MNWRRTRAVARKEFLHVLRDARSMGMAVAIPLLMLTLYGYALTLDVDRVPTVVWDQSGTAQSRKLTAGYSGSKYFDVVGVTSTNYRDLERDIDTRRGPGGPGHRPRLRQRIGRRPRPRRCSSSSTAATRTRPPSSWAMPRPRQPRPIRRRAHRQAGASAGYEAPWKRSPWTCAAGLVQPDLESKNYIVPGLIAVIMMVIAALLTSLTVAREWERGTMEQLISTPVKGSRTDPGQARALFRHRAVSTCAWPC
jgi:ABC-2 type transport system permease protein